MIEKLPEPSLEAQITTLKFYISVLNGNEEKAKTKLIRYLWKSFHQSHAYYVDSNIEEKQWKIDRWKKCDRKFRRLMLVVKRMQEKLTKVERALFLSTRWTVEGLPLSRESCEQGMGHFIRLAEEELNKENK